MSGVLRLTYLHFAAGGWRRWWFFIGVMVVGACLTLSSTNIIGKYVPLIAFLGAVAIFFGGSLMPQVVNRLAQSRQSCVLPFGRVALLGSAFLVTALVALPMPILLSLLMISASPQYEHVGLLHFMLTGTFLQFYAIVFWVCSAVYFLLPLFAQSRKPSMAVVSIAVMFGLMSIPRRLFLLGYDGINSFPMMLIGASWTLFALYVLNWPMWRSLGLPVVARFRSLLVWERVDSKFSKDEQFGLMLGLLNHWIHGLAAVMYVALITFSSRSSEPFLLFFFVTAMCFGAGASVGVTPAKSKALWLRWCGSRDELFSLAERAAWRAMHLSMLVVLGWFVVSGWYHALPTTRIVMGVAHIVLVFGISIYIGLLQTRGLHWGDGIAAIALASVIMLLTAYASSSTPNVFYVLIGDIATLALSIVIRNWAQIRWRNLDWLLCKPIRVGQ